MILLHFNKRTTASAWLTGLLTISILMALNSLAQPGGGVSGRNFRIPHYDQKTSKLISILSGSHAQQQSRNVVQVSGLVIETYSYEGNARTTNLVVTAPKCLVNLQQKVASSSGPLAARTLDGSLAIQGVGFEWRQSDSRLIISNDVKTAVARKVIFPDGFKL
ncbi:MAG: hypothetical protein CMO80_10780 [Verrucomicrobiales bacterium]|nr:hypothetical protein [Verrucomicrobiales bacterium]|tara:strand:+ start:10818 stop:11306 length:489 start_codon:yes stop_codon:yes gene_type:complete